MRVRKVSLKNFRNYESCEIDLSAGKTILIGENAQGKSNFLEAMELISLGKSTRADNDAEMILWGKPSLSVRVDVVSRHGDHSLELELAKALPQGRTAAGSKGGRLKRTVKMNGVTQPNARPLSTALITVSFKTTDLNLLRGGPKYRRDWIDSIAMRLRPALHDTYANYAKTLAQRNKLLKTIFEKGKVTVTDQDELLVWDKQLARFGAGIIKQRVDLLSAVMPVAAEHQRTLSRGTETLSAGYIFRSTDNSDTRNTSEFDDDDEDVAPQGAGDSSAGQSASSGGESSSTAGLDVQQAELPDIARFLLKLLRERRHLEIRRKQTTVGPHRDDISFAINDAEATSYASQGQQRSLVLALKLAELGCVREAYDEAPVLLLDDVLAELDTFRQGLLMSAVGKEMQSIITTTHISDFDPFWLDGATVLAVSSGQLAASDQSKCAQ